jgi:hypothetical protein
MTELGSTLDSSRWLKCGTGLLNIGPCVAGWYLLRLYDAQVSLLLYQERNISSEFVLGEPRTVEVTWRRPRHFTVHFVDSITLAPKDILETRPVRIRLGTDEQTERIGPIELSIKPAQLSMKGQCSVEKNPRRIKECRIAGSNFLVSGHFSIFPIGDIVTSSSLKMDCWATSARFIRNRTRYGLRSHHDWSMTTCITTDWPKYADDLVYLKRTTHAIGLQSKR